MSKTYHIITYGCQMNKCDSEVLASILNEHGYSYINDFQEADVLLLNTCSVRDTAERKVLGRLERLKHLKAKRPDMILGVCGCMAQSWEKELLKKFPYIDIILGTSRLLELPDLIEKRLELKYPAIDVLESPYHDEAVPTVRESSVTAWVTIMHGCNNFCSYCIVPYVRGRERSRSSSSILQEIKSLGEKGYKEITLLGQNVNSYGLDSNESFDFADLLAFIDKDSSGIERIRFTTSHPKDVSPKLIDAIAQLPKVCKHFHLPAQAGSNNVLAKMNRGYTREHYLNLIEKLREKVPGISITTDLIAGFPGETEEDFQDTLDLVRRAEFDIGFCFRYSPRRDTPAASMPDQLPEEVKMQRLYELLKIQDEISVTKNRAMTGTIHEVLVEGRNPKDESQLLGRTDTNKIVFFKGEADLIGQIITVKIVDAGNWSLRGELCDLD
ncbi:MAG: tRNA-2-methylthio-N6-dimethylallyladenosine synthase [Candidatus Poribacteria bacterium]|nr:tRNA-2-methylthio-N6-dimethylallyladenosine synthase [Candidatus Poribacteria bacterium]